MNYRKFFFSLIIMSLSSFLLYAENSRNNKMHNLSVNKATLSPASDFVQSYARELNNFTHSSENANLPGSPIITDSLILPNEGFSFYFPDFAETNASELNLDIVLETELSLENWMMELFEIEPMDKEIQMEEWMLQPFSMAGSTNK